MCHGLVLLSTAVISLYQGYRGYRLQEILGIQVKTEKDAEWEKDLSHRPNVRIPTKRDQTILLCIADGLTFFLCALTGCGAFLLLMGMMSGGPAAIQDHGVLFGFFLLYGVSGVTGKLPEGLAQISSKLS